MDSNTVIKIGMHFGTPGQYLSQMRNDVKEGKGFIHNSKGSYYFIPKGQEESTKELFYKKHENHPGYRINSAFFDEKGFKRWDSYDRSQIKDNMPFDRISAPDDTYAIDRNGNGVVDKGEIFNKDGKRL